MFAKAVCGRITECFRASDWGQVKASCFPLFQRNQSTVARIRKLSLVLLSQVLRLDWYVVNNY